MGDQCEPGSVDNPGSGNERSVDEILTLLSRKERRDIIDFCRSYGDRMMTDDELADHLAGSSRKAGEPADIDRMESSLRHQHLPRLANAGLIEYDPKSGRLRYMGDDRVERYLDDIIEE